MRPDSATDTQLDRFLRQEMAADEHRAFEDLLAREPELQDELLLRRDIIVGIRAAERQMLKDRLDRVIQQPARDNPFGQQHWQNLLQRHRWHIAIGLGAVLLVWLLAHWLST